MKLEMEREEYYIVRYSDLNKFINKYYSFETEYSFADDQETYNDSSHQFTVTDEIADYEEEDLKDVLENKFPYSFMTGTFLNDLARKNIIPKGNYLIEVCW